MKVPIETQLRQLSRCFPRSRELAVSQEMLEEYLVCVVHHSRYVTFYDIKEARNRMTYGPHLLTVWPE